MLGVSEQSLELELPQSPLLKVVGSTIEKNLLNHVPVYQQVKSVAAVGQLLDPNGKRTLTYFAQQLRNRGVALSDHDDVQMASQIEGFSGLHVEVEYISGLGPTYIKVLDGREFDPDELARLAVNSGLMMDYFVSQAAENPQEPFEVRAEDVGGLISFGYQAQPKGNLRLQAESSANASDDVVKMQVLGGEVTVENKVDGVDRKGRLSPVGGLVEYDPASRFVRLAKIAWEGNSDWVSTDHLLFGTRATRNVKIETYYEAKSESNESADESK